VAVERAEQETPYDASPTHSRVARQAGRLWMESKATDGAPKVSTEPSLFVGKGRKAQHLLLKRANRHGLIAGATGTGKTVTLQILAEEFSAQGVPVFMADVKGDLSGISQPGSKTHKLHDKLLERASAIGFDNYSYRGFPTVFWDLFGKKGHPIRTTISDMGPLMLARLLELNDTQEGVLNIAFRLADDNGLLLLDFKDLRAMMSFVAEQAGELSVSYGNVSKASVGAIQRRLLVLEEQGAKLFFGEPALALADLMRCDADGYGQINLLAADQLMQSPKLYSTFLLWLLSELFEELPEVGDPDKPVLVFFFDEAHLLFEDAPRALVKKVEQVVRLIRSKGVGVYFVSQNPTDIPDAVLGQLGNRVQHALRAFTAKDRKAVRAAADNFRENPAFEAREAITQLGVGEALVSVLDAKGIPQMVDRTLIRPPSSRLGPVRPGERKAIIEASDLRATYGKTVDRLSAFEKLAARAEQASEDTQKAKEEARLDKDRRYKPPPTPRKKTAARSRSSGSSRQGIMEAMAKSVVRALGSSLGRQLVRGLLGSFLKGR
jgi:DNA helicase HerA-like ATPase